jgi:uracil phosphoribosyltransferase
MLDTLLRYRPLNPHEFRQRVPEALRAKTDPEQFRRYAQRVFDLLAELAETESERATKSSSPQLSFIP